MGIQLKEGDKQSNIIEQIKRNIRSYAWKTLNVYGLIPSAVLIPIIEATQSIIFIKRTENVKDHKGQIAFPGGVMHSGELNPETTALRETEEEIGIPPEKVSIIGRLDDTITILGYLIHPVVGSIIQNVEIKANPAEVERIIILPIEDIVNAEYIEKETRWEFHVKGEIIWGATARILKNFLEASGLKKFK